MAEQTSLVAQQVRLMHWAEQIRECQNRLEGMDVSTWCEQNNITKANYYYPLTASTTIPIRTAPCTRL